jgi:hypothetical protein
MRTKTMTLKPLILPVLALLALALPARAADEGVSGAQFLRIGVDAKSAALGETGAAATGARALFYNPAGLAAIKGPELYLSHSRWIGETGYSGLAFARKAGAGAFGFAASYLSGPAIDKYDKFGNDLGETYSASDIAAVFGFCPKTDAALAFGLNLKYIRSKLDTETASAPALDAGLRWRAAKDKLYFGAALQNLGGELKYDAKGDPLPLNLKVGGQYLLVIQKGRTQRMDLAFFSDVNYLKDSGGYLNTGVDFLSAYDKDYLFALRAGYKTAANGGASGVSGGIGLEAAAYTVDYAFAPMGDLGSTHKFSVTVKFAGIRKK